MKNLVLLLIAGAVPFASARPGVDRLGGPATCSLSAVTNPFTHEKNSKPIFAPGGGLVSCLSVDNTPTVSHPVHVEVATLSGSNGIDDTGKFIKGTFANSNIRGTYFVTDIAKYGLIALGDHNAIFLDDSGKGTLTVGAGDTIRISDARQGGRHLSDLRPHGTSVAPQQSTSVAPQTADMKPTAPVHSPDGSAPTEQ